MSPPPVCENCKRFVWVTRKVGLMVGGDLIHVRQLCSACRVHVTDCFEQAAPWLDQRPATAVRR